MKVTLLKDHLQSKAGDEIEVTEGRAAYWQRLGVISGNKEEKKEVVGEDKKAETKATTEKLATVKKSAPKKVRNENHKNTYPVF